ncbi:MAG: hypothetical protein HYW63_04880 [Candidatus Levybacteria bacterium]|nr:hypothetical protein [Candidatus Levybacteria bacterium]
MINLSDFTTLDIFLAWLVIVSTTLFLWATYTLRNTNQRIKDIKDQEEKKWKDLEDKAQRDYQEILQSANKKAQEIILRATEVRQEGVMGFQDSAQKMFEAQKEAIKQISLALSNKYETELKKINEEHIKLLINIYKDIETSAKSDFTKYKDIIQKQTFDAERIAEQKIKEEYEKLESEIKELRQKKLNELNSEIDNIILNVSKEVIGKSLDLSAHENLIIEALEKAKKEKVI